MVTLRTHLSLLQGESEAYHLILHCSILCTIFVICVTFVISSEDSQCEDEWKICALTLIDRGKADRWYFF